MRNRILTVLLSAAACAAGQRSAMYFDSAHVIGDSTVAFRADGDLNGDGAKDLLSARNVAGIWWIKVYYRSGDSLVAGPSTQIAATPAAPGFPATSHFLAADLDGDGDEEIVYANNQGVAALSAADSNAAPALLWFFFVGGPIQGFAAQDLDADGAEDLILLTPGGVAVYRSAGTAPSVLWSSQPTVGGYSRWKLVAGEFDGVPPLDIAALGTNPGSSTHHLQIHSATAAVIAPPIFSQSLTGPTDPSFAVGDVDGDGDLDLALSKTNELLLLRRDPGLSFTGQSTVFATAETLADYDGDGDLDGLRSDGSNEQLALIVSRNDGAGNFLQYQTPFAASGSPGPVFSADFDGDGRVDLATGASVIYASAESSTHTHGSTAVHQRMVVDVDGDGDRDIGYRLDYAGFGSLYRNDGTGSFTRREIGYLLGPGAANAYGTPIDFDGDGRLDLVAGYGAYRNHSGKGLEFVHDSTASPPIGPPPGTDAAVSIAADLDDDGKIDLVSNALVPGSGPSVRFRIWWNQGGGVFLPGESVDDRYVHGAADLDGDGLPELLIHVHGGGGLGSSLGTLIYRKNLGNRTFRSEAAGGPQSAFASQQIYIFAPAFGDADADGDVDVVITSPTGSSLLANDGTGVFSVAAVFPEYSLQAVSAFAYFGGSPRLVDLDDDGQPEIVLGPRLAAPKSFAVFKSTGPGVYATPVVQFGDPVAFADLTGDGLPELVASTTYARNIRYTTAESGIVRQYGEPTSPTQYAAPLLGSAGAARAGGTFEIRITGGSPGTTGALIVGSAPLGVLYFGYPLLVVPELGFEATLSGAPGDPWPDGAWSAEFALPPWIAGIPFYFQAWLFDPTAGIATSNGLEVIFGS